MAEPNFVGISPRSFSSCSTKAEEESDSATPMTTASSTDRIAASELSAWNTFAKKEPFQQRSTGQPIWHWTVDGWGVCDV